ncbi:MAG: Fic family protein [Oscillospiraceae bacterium]|nr:Fic family protein [Oscillospiraceae bacterium]
MRQAIWKPVRFDPIWLRADTSRLDAVMPQWLEQRANLLKGPGSTYLEQLKRRQAIETGAMEGLYDLTRGATETLVREGFVESYVGHADCTIPAGTLMDLLKDQFEALNWVFDFIKSDRPLSVSYIKELHALITSHQQTAAGIDCFGNRLSIPLLHGDFKKRPNNPSSGGVLYLYCPPEQVDSEMDELIRVYHEELTDLHILIKAAWLHFAFVTIHPFQDGNGRVARLLASFVLIQGGLFPLMVERGNRKAYIDALEAADAGAYQPLIDLFAGDQINSIYLCEKR